MCTLFAYLCFKAVLQEGSKTKRAQKLSGSKFIKKAGSDSVDSCAKAEPREQIYGIKSRLQKWEWGYSLSHT
jgi:hypothetical protein